MKKRLDRFHEEEPDSWSPLDAPRRTSGSEFRMKRFLFLLLYVLAIFVVGLANSNAHWLMAAAGFLLFSIGAPRLRSPVVSAKEVKVWTIFGIHRVSLQKYCVALTDGGGINGPYRGRTVAIGNLGDTDGEWSNAKTLWHMMYWSNRWSRLSGAVLRSQRRAQLEPTSLQLMGSAFPHTQNTPFPL
jgi:hypothetical protein